MIFTIRHLTDDGEPDLQIPPMNCYDWKLCKGSATNIGDCIAKSPLCYDTESEARSSIAEVRGLGGALRFARVLVVEG